MDENNPSLKSQPPPADAAATPPLSGEPPYAPFLSAAGKAPQFDVTLIFSVLFKHKWKIATCTLLGLAGAAWCFTTIKPVYRSEAKLLIKFIQDNRVPIALGDEAKIKNFEQRTESIMNTEVELLNSTDLVEKVAAQVGPERVLDNPAAVAQQQQAANALHQGLSIEVPKQNGQVIRIAFSHRDATLTQTVVQQVIDAYQEKHAAVHLDVAKGMEFLTQEIDALRASLATTEKELRDIKDRAGVDSVEEARTTLTARASRLTQEIMAAEAELAEKRAVLAAHAGPIKSTTNTADPAGVRPEIPTAKAAEHRRVSELLALLGQREREYLMQYTPESLPVKGLRVQIAENDRIKLALEAEFPELKGSAPRFVTGTTAGTLVTSFDREADEGRIITLETRVSTLRGQLDTTRADIKAINEVEPLISELKRTKDEKELRLRYYSTNLDQAKIDARVAGGMNTNIIVLQPPSAPAKIPGRRIKLVAGFALGGIALGLGLAVLLEFFVDRSVRRPAEIEEVLGLPLFFSIPFIKGVAKIGRGGLATALPAGNAGPGATGAGPDEMPRTAGSREPPWSPAHGMRSFFDALRDRLVFYFEIRNFTRKPKLIAVTSCGDTAGVSTIASGLAASLSESGDGNVLLVDMNPGTKTPFRFHKGELKCDLDDALEQRKRDDALVQNNLYVVSHASGDDKLSSILPKRFTKLVPKLKASDYDYIIFDLPPVNQISATPQLARYMDMLLMVVESEKTARETTKRVGALFAENGVNFGVVLNKTRDYIPRPLRNLLASDT